MRILLPTPAQQLKSAAERFAGPWSARSIVPPASPAVAKLAANKAPRRQRAGESGTYRDEDLARLEAILFLSREPLSSRKLCQYANLADATRARTLVRRLNEQYDAAQRAFRVEQVAGGYQLLTRRKFAPWLQRLAHVPEPTRLSPPALETLAVIAYRQPVGRADIEAIRGVNCGEILRQLLERDFIAIQGRSQELGRPFLYATTKKFLQLFGLMTLDDLPLGAELKRSSAAAAPGPAAAASA